MQIKAEEISSIIKEKIKGFDQRVDVKEMGYVIQVGDNIAKVYMNLERYEDAIAELNKALAINEYYVEALLDLGICHLKVGEKEKARENFKKVLEIDPLGKLGSQAQEYLNLLE